jgi:hypothetical protein
LIVETDDGNFWGSGLQPLSVLEARLGPLH